MLNKCATKHTGLFEDTVSIVDLTAINQSFITATSYGIHVEQSICAADAMVKMRFQRIGLFITTNLPEPRQTDSPVFAVKLVVGGSELIFYVPIEQLEHCLLIHPTNVFQRGTSLIVGMRLILLRSINRSWCSKSLLQPQTRALHFVL
jgi:hypothetical protein